MHVFRSLLATSWLSILLICVTAVPISRPQAQSFDLDDQHLTPRVVHKVIHQGVLHKFVSHFAKKSAHTPNVQHFAAHKHAAHPAVGKHAVAAAFRHSMREKRKMTNMPGKDKKFTNGQHTYTGTDAHKAVLHSLMLQKINKQVGRSKYPHVFHNYPYPKTHPDPTAAGKTPIPIKHATMPVMHEYPIKKGTSFLGLGKPGPARVVASANEFHGVISHDASRKGTKGDHYLMQEVDR